MELNATPADYAKAMKQLLAAGRSVDELNAANHKALEKEQITLNQFQAGAQVLVEALLKGE